MNYLSAIQGFIGDIAGGVAGGVLGSGSLGPPPVVVVPPPDYTPLYVAGFVGLTALILWKR